MKRSLRGKQTAMEEIRAMTSNLEQTVPVVVLAMGDPAGISPELTAGCWRLHDVREAARLVVIGDRRVLEDGARVAKVTLDVETSSPRAPVPTGVGRPVFVDLGHLDPGDHRARRGARGRRPLRAGELQAALASAGDGRRGARGLLHALQQGGMRLAHPTYDDEILFTPECSASPARPREFNVLDGLWNARVTSHVPLVGGRRRCSRGQRS